MLITAEEKKSREILLFVVFRSGGIDGFDRIHIGRALLWHSLDVRSFRWKL